MFLRRIWRNAHAASRCRAQRSVYAAAEKARQRCGFALCLTVLSPHVGRVVSQAPQAGASITLWVKRMDVTGAQFVAVKGVDVLETLDDFKARWVAQEQLDARPSLVTLRLVKRGAGKPTEKQEAKAKVLDDPSLSLAQVKVTGTAWLLAFVAGTKSSEERLAMSATSVPGACIARISLPPLPFAHSTIYASRRSSFPSGRLCAARRELRAQ